MNSLKWYKNRLAQMSLPEILYRVNGKKKDVATRLGLAPRLANAHRVDLAGRRWVAGNPAANSISVTLDAEQILDGRFALLALDDVAVSWPPAWNTDPRTGTRGPLDFGRSINYRDEKIVGDIKYLWELNRHLELPRLAQAFYLTGEERYLDGVVDAWTSWLRQNPFPLGVNWASPLEFSIRLINWAVAWNLIEARAANAIRRRGDLHASLLNSIYLHQAYTERHFSAYSSANNHLIGEAAGLYVASVTWPCWSESSRWQRRGHEILEREALQQIAPDGSSREQTLAYLYFVLEFLLLSAAAGRAAGECFSNGYWQRIDAALAFGRSMYDCAGNKPNIGDSDDGCVLRLAGECQQDQQRVLESLRCAFDYDGQSDHGDLDRAAWFPPAQVGNETDQASISAQQRHEQLSAHAPVAFTDGGYFLLGTRLGQPDEIRCIIDCGPLGFLSIAAHGHADALSIILSASGHRFLIDPGTFAYHTDRAWRSYFRGTAAHNTIRVDGVDQSVIGGNFMWLKHANATLKTWSDASDRQVFCGSHDGYTRLADPVVHQRQVQFDTTERRLLVIDDITCNAPHKIEHFWHLAPECQILDAQTGNVLLQSGSEILRIRIDVTPSMRQSILFGSHDPIRGWYSDKFGVKEPTYTVCWSHDVVESHRFETVFQFLGSG